MHKSRPKHHIQPEYGDEQADVGRDCRTRLARPNSQARVSEYVWFNIYSKSMDQPGKVVNPARGQLNRENEYFPVRVRA